MNQSVRRETSPDSLIGVWFSHLPFPTTDIEDICMVEEFVSNGMDNGAQPGTLNSY